MASKEFKKLEKENSKIRDKIDKRIQICYKNDDINRLRLWSLVNELIENEIEQEEYCN